MESKRARVPSRPSATRKIGRVPRQIDARTCTATAGCWPAPVCGTLRWATGCPSPRKGSNAAAATATGSAAAAPTWAIGSSPARRRSAPAAPPPDTANSRRPPRTSDRHSTPLDGSASSGSRGESGVEARRARRARPAPRRPRLALRPTRSLVGPARRPLPTRQSARGRASGARDAPRAHYRRSPTFTLTIMEIMPYVAN
ncbi:unnamed protein product [Pieris brassicae]|uniref:Uncharacterized protein n=1 Tax=Pieris brassicae TaxID=7116 RepID=A0A9P0TZ02_PIEBR|nr:unnamed protein product [Pieris brassicae]